MKNDCSASRMTCKAAVFSLFLLRRPCHHIRHASDRQRRAFPARSFCPRMYIKLSEACRSFRALCICIHKQLQLLCDRNKQRNASDARNNRRRRTFRSQAPCRKCRRRHVCHKPAAFRTCRVAAASMRSISFLKINIIECHCIHIFYCFYLAPSLIRAADTCILYYLISYVVSCASVNVYDIVGCVSIYIAPFFHEP